MIHKHLHPDAIQHAKGILDQTPLADNLDHLVRQARACVRLYRDENALAMGVSQVGGLPLLASDMDWPIWDPTELYRAQLTEALAKGKPKKMDDKWFQQKVDGLRAEVARGRRALNFLVQIDLTEVSRPDLLGLPA